MPKTLTVLGFDFGMKRIGVAVGQTVTHTATPLLILKAQDGVPQWSEVEKLIHDWQADALIVGLPLNMDDTYQPVTFCAKRFANKLNAKYKLPVHLVDERLSTRAARRIAENDEPVDAIAAQLILETWLQTKENE